MTYPALRTLLRWVVSAGAVAFASALAQSSKAPAGPQPVYWYKGNLHTHSLWSDGDDYPEMVADWYKRNGYNFLALSDHNIIADHEHWLSLAKNKGAEHALKKYADRFGEKWVELRGPEGNREVRLKTLGEFRVPLEEPGHFLM